MRALLTPGAVQKSSIIDQILNWANRKADKELKKTDGKGRQRYYPHLAHVF